MKSKIQAGADIEFVTPAELKETLRGALEDWKLEFARGVRLRRITTSTTTAAVTGSYQLGGDVSSDEFGPRQGFCWTILRFSVLGTFTNTDFSRVYLNSVSPSTFVTDIQAPAGGPLTSMERDFSPGTSILTPDDKLIVVGTGTPNTSITANFTAVQFPVQMLTRLYLS